MFWFFPHNVIGMVGNFLGRFSLVSETCFLSFFFFSFFRFLFLAWYEERKLRVTGTRTFTRTRWTQGVSCYASTFAAFDDFLLFLFFSPFYVCASSAAFWLKRAIWGIASLGCPLFGFYPGTHDSLLRPLGFSQREFGVC